MTLETPLIIFIIVSLAMLVFGCLVHYMARRNRDVKFSKVYAPFDEKQIKSLNEYHDSLKEVYW